MGRQVWLGARIIMIVMVVFLASLTLPGAAAAEFGDEKFKPGDAAVDFTAVDLDGKSYTLSSYKGNNVVLLNFWGLRCGACIEEMPHLNALSNGYKDKGVVVLGVGTDGVDAQITRDTMKEVGISADYTLLLDEEFTITDTYTNFLVPLTIVIDKKGIIQYIHTGYEQGMEKEYEKAVKDAL